MKCFLGLNFIQDAAVRNFPLSFVKYGYIKRIHKISEACFMKIMTNVCVGNLCHVVLALNTFIIISHEENENHVQYIEYGSRKYIKKHLFLLS